MAHNDSNGATDRFESLLTSKARTLRRAFEGNGVVRCLGAHDGLSAKLAERAGADAIWASGLEVSTAHAVPDANILTMTDYLRSASFMNDAVDVPVVADCDTGYGNVNNVIHMVRRYEAAGIAAVCIEDKQFPKVNSFVPGRQELAAIGEFVGKIRAAKKAQRTQEFMLLARVEALIAGWGHDEARRRAHAYVEAGADGILIHSKQPNPDEIVRFIEEWDAPVPLVIVPTTYPQLSLSDIQALNKVRMVIYANHGLRSSIVAMSNTFKEILAEGTTATVEPKIAPLKEVFALQGMPELKDAEKQWGHTGKDPIRAIIPAAGQPQDAGLRNAVGGGSVAKLAINGKPLLQRQLELLNNTGIQDVRVVVDQDAGDFSVDGATMVKKDGAVGSHMVGSVLAGLQSASLQAGDRLLVLYADILFDRTIVERLSDCDGDVTLVVDRAFASRSASGKTVDLIEASLPRASDGRHLASEARNQLQNIGDSVTGDAATHEFIGMALFSVTGVQALTAVAASAPAGADLTWCLKQLLDGGTEIDVLEVERGWSEVHTLADRDRVAAQLAGAPYLVAS
ncbi:MAG: isocitrate lyase/phosphoenolpyruvate mutase family protein [Myxococcales bacterium]|nr:isocitrate lyase/phosphoenolpyruvate mutase family protein [Myxococcales bacterium]